MVDVVRSEVTSWVECFFSFYVFNVFIDLFIFFIWISS